MRNQTVLITGASSGFGLLTSVELAKQRIQCHRHNEEYGQGSGIKATFRFLPNRGELDLYST